MTARGAAPARVGARILAAAAVLLGLAGCAGDTAVFPSTATTGGAATASAAAAETPFPTSDPDLQLVSTLPAPRASEGGGDDLLVAGDVLQMDVFGVDKLNRTMQVDARGFVSPPLLGPIRAAGRSLTTLEREIADNYGRNYLRSPSVALTLKESPSRRVVVDGEVVRSGVFNVTSRSTLMEAIAQAGGFNQIADPNKVYVYRNFGGRKYVANYDIAAIREGKLRNPTIYGGDVVVVFSSGTRVAWQNLKDVLGVARNVVGGATIK